jgi:catechol 2,3-dioxygenase-like lactoylglutathione lyase family enzyme
MLALRIEGSFMKLYRVILPVSDIDGAAKFYGRIFGVEGMRVSPGRHYFDCEGTILACCDPRADGDGGEVTPNPDHIYFAVDDIEQVYEKAKAAGASFPPGVTPHTGPMGEIAKRPWGERSFYVSDPFGNKICFVDRKTVFTGKR